jgi:hypothetical protein
LIITAVSEKRVETLHSSRNGQLLQCAEVLLLPPLERLLALQRVVDPQAGESITRPAATARETRAQAVKAVARLCELHRAKWKSEKSGSPLPEHWVYMDPNDVTLLGSDELEKVAALFAQRKTATFLRRIGMLPRRRYALNLMKKKAHEETVGVCVNTFLLCFILSYIFSLYHVTEYSTKINRY